MRHTSALRLICIACVAIAIAASVRVSGTVQSPATTVAPAMLQWRIGIERATPPTEMVETIAPFERDGRRMWRVTHYAFDPTAEDGSFFDLYDVDASTFAPVRSVMRNPAFRLTLTFAPGRVALLRTEKGTTMEEQVPLAGAVKPEGPGLTVFVAGLPLKNGYTLDYQTVDRWSGKERTRLEEMSLTVRGRRRMETLLGPQDVFDIVIRPKDGSFQIVEYVRTVPPHLPFRVEYTRGKTFLVSAATSMAIQSFAGA